ncbi:MAG: thioredoxin-disulfide reductase [Candidatus Woesearchaeota archaeon]
MYEIIIIGGGIAAHSAAIYASRAQLKPLVLAGIEPDQLSYTTEVENYPGFPEGVEGPELVMNARKQAERFGAQYVAEKVESVTKIDSGFQIKTNNNTYDTKAVIVATGAAARMLHIPGEKDFFGKGVSSCAVCDAAFYKDKEVVVIGGGDSAMEESLILARFAKKITIVHRRDEFRASKIMQEKVFALKDKISIVWDTVPVEVLGENNKVVGIKLQNVKDKTEQDYACDGVFLAIGHIPNSSFVKDLVECDDLGYIKTTYSATSCEGIFAAGDCQDPTFRQAITSAGSGCMASLSAERYLERLE